LAQNQKDPCFFDLQRQKQPCTITCQAGKAAEYLAIRNNTAIITMIDGHLVRLTAEKIIKRREAASSTSEATEE
jgi:hypothetical protein